MLNQIEIDIHFVLQQRTYSVALLQLVHYPCRMNSFDIMKSLCWLCFIIWCKRPPINEHRQIGGDQQCTHMPTVGNLIHNLLSIFTSTKDRFDPCTSWKIYVGLVSHMFHLCCIKICHKHSAKQLSFSVSHA